MLCKTTHIFKRKRSAIRALYLLQIKAMLNMDEIERKDFTACSCQYNICSAEVWERDMSGARKYVELGLEVEGSEGLLQNSNETSLPLRGE